MPVRNEPMGPVERRHRRTVHLSLKGILHNPGLAAEAGHLEVVKILLARHDVDINVEDVHGETPLYQATRGEHPAIVRMLLPKAEIQPHPRHHHGSTPLLLAARAGHTYIVKLLLARDNFNMSAVDNGEDTPMVCVEPGWERVAMTRRTMLELLECEMLQAAVEKHSSRQVVA